MMMKKQLGQLINTLLSRIGLKLITINKHDFFILKYNTLIKELHGCFSELIFPELPPCNNRVKLLSKLMGTQVSEALYILEFLHKSIKLEGDVCEFGVAQGTTSALLANEIVSTYKNLWLFDSFKGLPKPTEKDLLIDDIFNLGSIKNYEGTMCSQINEVKYRLKEISFPFERAKIIPGFIEETIKYENLPNKICFAYVDFDFYNPTAVALKFLDKHLSAGGFVVVDDYGFFSSGVKTAVEELTKDIPKKFEITLPYKFAGHFCILRKKHE